MKAYLVVIAYFSYISFLFSQVTNTKQLGSDSLESKKRFETLILDNNIDSVNSAVFLKTFERDGFQSHLYEINNEELMNLGESKVDRILVRTFNGTIYGIDITMKKDIKIMKTLEKLYGISTYDGINQTYFWRMEGFNVRFKSRDKRHIEITYHSLSYQAMIKDEKTKKIKSISDDF